MKIAICGSMAFSPEMIEIGENLKKKGYDVMLPEFTKKYSTMDSREGMHSEAAENKIKYDLIRQYYNEIVASDAVLVLNKTRKGIENYVGGNSFLEMAFAHIHRKKIYLMNPVPEMGYSDEMKAMTPVILNGDLDGIKQGL